MPRIEEFNKEDVLQKAMNVFWEKGYSATSMQDLVDATGLNRSSIYNSFGSKMELYQDTLSEYQKKTVGIFQKVLLRAKNPLDAIRSIFENFLPEIAEDVAGKGCFVLSCKAEMGNGRTDIQKWLLEIQEHSLALFKGLVEDGQELGLINRDASSKDYAYFIFNSFQGFRMTGILVKDRAVLQQIIDNTIKVIT